MTKAELEQKLAPTQVPAQSAQKAAPKMASKAAPQPAASPAQKPVIAREIQRSYHRGSLIYNLILWILVLVEIILTVVRNNTENCVYWDQCSCDCTYDFYLTSDESDCGGSSYQCNDACTSNYINFCDGFMGTYIHIVGYILIGVAYLIYLYECCKSDSLKFLRNQFEIVEYGNFLAQVKKNAPSVFFVVECYHYETRTTTSTIYVNNVPQTTFQTHTVKVVSSTNSQQFKYASWSDTTGDPTGITSHKLIKLKVEKLLVFADDATEKEYNRQKQIHTDTYKNRDTHFNAYMQHVINGYQEQMLVKSGSATKPFLLNIWFFVLFSMIGFSWPYRMWFEFLVDNKAITIKKRIKI